MPANSSPDYRRLFRRPLLRQTPRRAQLQSRTRSPQQNSRLQKPTTYRAQIPIARALARGFLHSAFFDAGPRAAPTFPLGAGAEERLRENFPFQATGGNVRSSQEQTSDRRLAAGAENWSVLP